MKSIGQSLSGNDGKANFSTSWNDTNTVPSQPSVGVLNSFLQNSITSYGTELGINDWQHAPIYVVVSDPASSAGFNGGWNAQGFYYWRDPGLGGLLTWQQTMHMIWVWTSGTGAGRV
jgi:hypothetical protein